MFEIRHARRMVLSKRQAQRPKVSWLHKEVDLPKNLTHSVNSERTVIRRIRKAEKSVEWNRPRVTILLCTPRQGTFRMFMRELFVE